MKQNIITKKFYNKSSYSRIFLKKFYNEISLKNYKSFFLTERKKYFSKLKINKKNIMLDAGTGRQSIALASFFKKIDHFDISEAHVSFIKKKIKYKKYENITSTLADLERVKFNIDYYDFINLDGVVMHTHSPEKLLKNVLNSTKINGLTKILLYKKGSLKFILVEFLRELVKIFKIKIKDPYSSQTANWLFEDDLYVPYIRFFDDKDLIKFICKISGCSKENIKHKNINERILIDTKNFHHSLSIFFHKKKITKNLKKIKLKNTTQLSREFLKKDKLFYSKCGHKILEILKNKRKIKNKPHLQKFIIEVYKIALFNHFYSRNTYLQIIDKLNLHLKKFKKIK